MPLGDVLRKLTVVLEPFVCEKITGKALLSNHISDVLLVCKDAANGGLVPFCFASSRFRAQLFQPVGNLRVAFASQEFVVDHFDHACAYRLDDNLLLAGGMVYNRVVAEKPAGGTVDVALLIELLKRPFDVLTYRARLILSQRTEDCENQLALTIQAVDVLLLEIHAHWLGEAFQLSHRFEAVNGVSSKSGDALCYD